MKVYRPDFPYRPAEEWPAKGETFLVYCGGSCWHFGYRSNADGGFQVSRAYESRETATRDAEELLKRMVLLAEALDRVKLARARWLDSLN